MLSTDTIFRLIERYLMWLGALLQWGSRADHLQPAASRQDCCWTVLR